jgi:replicative DNA helicase
MIKTFHSGAEVERLIVTGMIVSGTYLSRISKIYKADYFQIDYAKRIAEWCLEYHGSYSAAPRRHIEDMFRSRRREFQDGQGELAEEFLRQISKEHEARDSFNDDYLFEKTRKYFHKRALLILADKVEGFTMSDKVDRAQQAIKEFQSVATDISPWINPLSDAFIVEVFRNIDSNRILQFPGQLGSLIGPFERGWLVGWLGPMKRGKTFWLFECAIRAAMQRLNAVIVSLEMNAPTNAMRIYRRMTALPDEPGDFVFPVFDCASNQDGSCKMEERAKFNDVPLFLDPEQKRKPLFSSKMDYRPCTFCRGNRSFSKEDNPYITEVWYRSTEISKVLTSDAVMRARRQFLPLSKGERLRFRAYPAFSASIEDLESDLETLEFTEGFIPDVIVVDYADILIPPDKRLIERSALDSIWKGLKGMAEKRNCLVITASQSNRTGITRESSLEQTDVAEDIRKLAHVDAMFGLNQSKTERSEMVMRVNTLAHRHRAFHPFLQAFVLNQLDLGLPCIDSEIIMVNSYEHRDDKK